MIQLMFHKPLLTTSEKQAQGQQARGRQARGQQAQGQELRGQQARSQLNDYHCYFVLMLCFILDFVSYVSFEIVSNTVTFSYFF